MGTFPTDGVAAMGSRRSGSPPARQAIDDPGEYARTRTRSVESSGWRFPVRPANAEM